MTGRAHRSDTNPRRAPSSIRPALGFEWGQLSAAQNLTQDGVLRRHNAMRLHSRCESEPAYTKMQIAMTDAASKGDE